MTMQIKQYIVVIAKIINIKCKRLVNTISVQIDTIKKKEVCL